MLKWKLRKSLTTTIAIAKLNISSQFNDSALGFYWLFLSPFFTLCAYILAFSFVFSGRWESSGYSSLGEFIVFLYSGMLVLNAFSEVVSQSAGLYFENPNYIKKIRFPLEVLNGTVLVKTTLGLVFGSVLLVLLSIINMGHLPNVLILYGLILPPFIIFLYGLSICISTIGLFLTDLKHSTGMLTHLALFLSPVFYSIKDVPEPIVYILKLNPLVYTIELIREVVFKQNISFDHIMISWVFSILVACCGIYIHKALKLKFADAL